MKTKNDWRTFLSDTGYDLLKPFLTPTRFWVDYYPCPKGCVRDVIEFNDQYIGICSLPEKHCDNRDIDFDEIRQYSLDAMKLATTINHILRKKYL